MKRFIIIYTLLVIFWTPSFSQVTTKLYGARLTREQMLFRNYGIGIKKMVNDSVAIVSEPLFDYVVESGDMILVQMSIRLLDGGNNYLDENLIWACLSNDLKIRFLFPLGTEAAYYDSESRTFYYSTSLSGSRYWYNSGVIDYDGHVIYPANGFNKHASVNGDTIVIREWLDRFKSNKNDYEKLRLTFLSKKKPSLQKEITISVPDAYSWWIDPCVFKDKADDITEDERLFCSAVYSLVEGVEKKQVVSLFKELQNSSDSVLSQFARDSIKGIKKL